MSNTIFELQINDTVNNLSYAQKLSQGWGSWLMLSALRCTQHRHYNHPHTTLHTDQLTLGHIYFCLRNLTWEPHVAKIHMELWADSGIKVAL